MCALTLNTSDTPPFDPIIVNAHHLYLIFLDKYNRFPLSSTGGQLPNHTSKPHRQTESHVIPSFPLRFTPNIPFANRFRCHTAVSVKVIIHWSIVRLALALHTNCTIALFHLLLLSRGDLDGQCFQNRYRSVFHSINSPLKMVRQGPYGYENLFNQCFNLTLVEESIAIQQSCRWSSDSCLLQSIVAAISCCHSQVISVRGIKVI